MKSYLLDLTKYNLWANERIAGFILAGGSNLADQEQKSSFPTIRKTLYHIWDAQVIWLSRLEGQSLNNWPSQKFSGTLEEALSQFLSVSNDFVRFVGEKDDSELEKEVLYHSIDKTRFSQKASEIILHVINHSTYHRGQLITMLRGAGFEGPGSTDLIRYYRTR